MDLRWLSAYLLVATALMERDRERAEGVMGLFGDPPKHIDRIKERVRERDAIGALKLSSAFTDYVARLDEAERRVVKELDAHALAQEAALQELTNRGGDVAESATGGQRPNGADEPPPAVDAKPEVAADKLAGSFPEAAE